MTVEEFEQKLTVTKGLWRAVGLLNTFNFVALTGKAITKLRADDNTRKFMISAFTSFSSQRHTCHVQASAKPGHAF